MYWLASYTFFVACLMQSGSFARAAQIPPELSQYFHTGKNLIASFANGTYNITQPAQIIPIADTQEIPKIFVLDLHVPPPYLLLMVDPSYNKTVPTNTALHTMEGNLTARKSPNQSDQSSHSVKTALISSTPPIAPYAGPQPPKNDPNHDYTLLLFSQPKNFTIPAKYDSWMPLNLSNIYTRVNFPVVDFVRDTGLGQPVAATYFRVNLTSGSTTSTTGSSSPTGGQQAPSTTTATGGTAKSLGSWTVLFGFLFSTCVYWVI